MQTCCDEELLRWSGQGLDLQVWLVKLQGTLLAGGARPAAHLNLRRSTFSLCNGGLGSRLAGYRRVFRKLFFARSWSGPSWLAMALAWLQILQPGSVISAALPFSETFLDRTPSPWNPNPLEPERAGAVESLGGEE